MEVTFNNVRECEQAGLVGLIAYSPVTGEQEKIPPTSKWGLARCFPDVALEDSRGNPFVVAMGTPDVLVLAIEDDAVTQALNDLAAINEVFDILEDYLALDRLEQRGYFR
jgi:hypothetical protein